MTSFYVRTSPEMVAARTAHGGSLSIAQKQWVQHGTSLETSRRITNETGMGLNEDTVLSEKMKRTVSLFCILQGTWSGRTASDLPKKTKHLSGTGCGTIGTLRQIPKKWICVRASTSSSVNHIC